MPRIVRSVPLEEPVAATTMQMEPVVAVEAVVVAAVVEVVDPVDMVTEFGHPRSLPNIGGPRLQDLASQKQ